MDLTPDWHSPTEQERRLKYMSTFGNIKLSITDWASEALNAVRKLEQTLHGILDAHAPERKEDQLVCKNCLTEDPVTGKANRVPYPCPTVLFVAQNLAVTTYMDMVNRG